MSDIVQLQDLHQTAFISSLNWAVGRPIKSRKGLFSVNIVVTASYLTPQSVSAAKETFAAGAR